MNDMIDTSTRGTRNRVSAFRISGTDVVAERMMLAVAPMDAVAATFQAPQRSGRG